MLKKKARKKKKCDICGRSHYKLTRRQCVQRTLWSTLKEGITLRDRGLCQKCGRACRGDESHMSHVYRASRCGRLKFNEDNVKILCSHCHRGWWHNNEAEAGVWFSQTFPDRWERLSIKIIEYRDSIGTISMPWYLERLDQLREYVLDQKG